MDWLIRDIRLRINTNKNKTIITTIAKGITNVAIKTLSFDILCESDNDDIKYQKYAQILITISPNDKNTIKAIAPMFDGIKP